MNASFEERSVRITLGGLVLVFGLYFAVAGRMLTAGSTESVAPFLPVFAVATGLLVLLLVVGHTLAAVAESPEDRDERDRMIAWKAENDSSWLLCVGVLAAIFGLATPIDPAWIANGLLATLFLSEVLKRALQLRYYRRGI